MSAPTPCPAWCVGHEDGRPGHRSAATRLPAPDGDGRLRISAYSSPYSTPSVVIVGSSSRGASSTTMAPDDAEELGKALINGRIAVEFGRVLVAAAALLTGEAS
ncbi:hypothetical protein [Streptosporangium saharense]|uniref:hypothetical protein n=1 Tax=Streptosporangium saharense TaxID=1706840 RepID=UPI0033237F59